MTGRVHDMILDPKLTGQLPEVISEGAYYGMQTFDQHLLQHLHAGRVTMEAAMRVATSPHDFKLMVAAAGKKLGEDSADAAPVSSEPVGPPLSSEPVGSPVSSEPVGPPPSPEPAPAPAPSFETSSTPPSAPPSYETTPPPSAPSAPPPGVTY